MRYVEAAGVRVSAIGLGTWQFGISDWGYGPEYARAWVGPAEDWGTGVPDSVPAPPLGSEVAHRSRR